VRLLSIAEEYCEITDSYVIANCQDCVTVGVPELMMHQPLATVEVNGRIHTSLPYRMLH